MFHAESQDKLYKVTVPVSKVNELLKAEAWPVGVGVSRLRNTKDRDGNK